MTPVVVGIVDYQAGNIHSVSNALEHAGANGRRIREPRDADGCTHLLLPGVGAFGFCADSLRGSGLLPMIERWALIDHRPLLGICVGMQLMADYSEEDGRHEGLGWIGGAVRKIEREPGSPIRVPHVGWNEVRFREPFGRLGAGESPNFYFDHSYAYTDPVHGRELGQCTHGRAFSAVIRRDNIVAVQFHPEKSQEAGMRVLQSFFEM
jgi:glutamine amidotransferase